MHVRMGKSTLYFKNQHLIIIIHNHYCKPSYLGLLSNTQASIKFYGGGQPPEAGVNFCEVKLEEFDEINDFND